MLQSKIGGRLYKPQFDAHNRPKRVEKAKEEQKLITLFAFSTYLHRKIDLPAAFYSVERRKTYGKKETGIEIMTIVDTGFTFEILIFEKAYLLKGIKANLKPTPC